MCLPSKEAHARLLEVISQQSAFSSTNIDTLPSSPGKTVKRTGNDTRKTQGLSTHHLNGIAVDDHSMFWSIPTTRGDSSTNDF